LVSAVFQPELGERLTLRDRLRASTSALHARLDGAMEQSLRSGTHGYQEFLLANAAGLLPLEQALEEAGVEETLPDWPERARSAALIADLEDLGLRAPAPRAVVEGGLLRDEAYQLGTLYVLEGSRLGARMILRGLPDANWPTRYLSHGRGKPFWQTFLARLEESAPAQTNPQAVVAGASAAFALFMPDGAG
jgi:heme oxygenase